MNRRLVFYALLTGLLGYEAWTVTTGPEGDTISEIVWSATDRWPVLLVLFGAIGGHFFWPRKVK